MRHVPQRTCIGCRAAHEKSRLVRVVRSPEGSFSLDPGGKAAGRGAYLCAALPCLEAAVKRRSFDRAFRQTVPREAVEALREAVRAYVAAAAGETA